MGTFKCACGDTFDSGHLKVHQKSCTKAQETRKRLLEERAASASSKKARRASRVSATASTSSTGPSTSSIQLDDDPMVVDPIDALGSDLAVDTPATAFNTSIPSVPGPEAVAAEPTAEPVAEPSLGPRRRTQHRVPAKFRDLAPEPLAPAVPAPSLATRILQAIAKPFETAVNAFGLYRVFTHGQPSSDPNQGASPNPVPAPASAPASSSNGNPWYPYPNRSCALFNNWFWNEGSTKTRSSRQSLIDLLFDNDFILGDLQDVNWEQLDKAVAGDLGDFGDGWISETVYVRIPGGKGKDTLTVPVDGFQRRSLIGLWKNEIETNPSSDSWTWTPSKLMHQNSAGRKSRTAGEVYHSPRAHRLHNEVQRLPREDGDDLERCVLFLMQGSDGTQLAQFGTSSAWPGYTSAGNISKYVRGRRDAHSLHHFASFPKLPDSVHDEIKKLNLSKSAKRNILTHVRRELMHRCWDHILDDEFLTAYKHGFVVKCQDGITRRVFPRFFTYSADYPEKVLLATLRDKGACPCPRCCVKMKDIHLLGTPEDEATRRETARQHDASWMTKVKRTWSWITSGIHGLKASKVENLLAPLSWVPTPNAFSVLKPIHSTFSIFALMAVDILHDFELGVWKAVLMHILRILQAYDPSKLEELDSRFRRIPVFGRFSIRRFSNNVSELKQLAAHNFEDILQCAIPAFDGLLDEPHNTIVMTLLFLLAEWHALAKLRLHTEETLEALEAVTRRLGAQLRLFVRETCSAFLTTELPREKAARARRKAKKPQTQTRTQPDRDAEVHEKTLNINTYKTHTLGDYPPFIRECGTTDSYSTALTEHAHPIIKERYRRSNKRGADKQMAEMERIQENTRRIIQLAEPRLTSSVSRGIDEEAIDLSHLDEHHDVSLRQKEYIEMGEFLRARSGQPAFKDFAPRLRDHLLNRIRRSNYDGDETTYSNEERNRLVIVKGRMYTHKLMNINFTTYDVRRGQDIIHVGKDKCDVMLRSCEDDDEAHPFWYARVLGIYHVNAYDTAPGSSVPSSKPMLFLHVRWFGRDLDFTSTDERPRLTRLGWDKDNEFGFVDPHHVLRACHIVPAFAHGEVPHRVSLHKADTDLWKAYYVMRWSDRDLFMRYNGGGIGHAVSLAKPYNTSVTHARVDDADDEASNPEETATTIQIVDDEMEGGTDDEGEGQADDDDVVRGEEEGSDDEEEGSEYDMDDLLDMADALAMEDDGGDEDFVE